MGRRKIVDIDVKVGMSNELHEFLKSEADQRGCSIVDVVRMAIFDMKDRRKEIEVALTERKAAALERLRSLKG